jgi:hypothetical protein
MDDYKLVKDSYKVQYTTGYLWADYLLLGSTAIHFSYPPNMFLPKEHNELQIKANN